MGKFFEWFGKHRKPIGYTVGGVNVLAALNELALGNVNSAVTFFILGAAILFDTYMFK